MRIKGYFNPDLKPPAPFIEVVVVWEKVGLNNEIRLLLDIGFIAQIRDIFREKSVNL